MTYCWKCRVCGDRAESTQGWQIPICPDHGDMVRDYHAEGVGLSIENLRKEH